MRIWTQEEVKQNLLKSDRWVIRAFQAIHFTSQTREERDLAQTIEKNKRGFNKFDAPFFSRIIESYGKSEFAFIPPRLMVVCRKKMMKYTKQLTEIANRGT